MLEELVSIMHILIDTSKKVEYASENISMLSGTVKNIKNAKNNINQAWKNVYKKQDDKKIKIRRYEYDIL
jgi:hypothetical protein